MEVKILMDTRLVHNVQVAAGTLQLDLYASLLREEWHAHNATKDVKTDLPKLNVTKLQQGVYVSNRAPDAHEKGKTRTAQFVTGTAR